MLLNIQNKYYLMISDNVISNIDSILMNIYKHGKYYNPAWDHYGQGAIVSCDRCQRTQLKICLGWDKYDMCLKCAEEMSLLVSRKHHTFMIQDTFVDSGRRTKMRQDMYRTNMEQGMYKTNQTDKFFEDDLFDNNMYKTLMAQEIYKKINENQ